MDLFEKILMRKLKKNKARVDIIEMKHGKLIVFNSFSKLFVSQSSRRQEINFTGINFINQHII